MSESEILKVDVEGILKAKNPALAKKLPRFLIRYLKRIVHQDEVNSFMEANRENYNLDFVDSVIKYMDLKIVVKGFENVPKSGRFVFAANHPLGGLESIVLMKVISEKFSDFTFVVNDILMVLTPLSGLFVPINKHGSQSREGLNRINEAYSSNRQLLYFPAGLVSRKIKGKIIDLKWQKSFVSKSIEYDRDIVPVYIDGNNSRFFYNLSNLRKFFGIKVNIEMLYLVDEMIKQKGKTISLTFGEPIPNSIFDKSKNISDWADYLRDLTYSLKNKH
jgi:putative hemolysin